MFKLMSRHVYIRPCMQEAGTERPEKLQNSNVLKLNYVVFNF